MGIVLASASPRRSELLKQAGIEFTVDVSEADEDINVTVPSEYVEELSRRKAKAVAARHPDDTVIGADTVVVYMDEILGKPADNDEAYDMLCMLSGRTHEVYTGVTIIHPPTDASDGYEETFHVRTLVTMYENDRRLLREYADCGEPLDKAGAYGIQGRGAVLVERIEGDYCNVVGLPLAEVYRRVEIVPKYV